MTITLIHKSNTIRVTDELLSVNKRFYQVFLTSEHVLTGDGDPRSRVPLIRSMNQCRWSSLCQAGKWAPGAGVSVVQHL